MRKLRTTSGTFHNRVVSEFIFILISVAVTQQFAFDDDFLCQTKNGMLLYYIGCFAIAIFMAVTVKIQLVPTNVIFMILRIMTVVKKVPNFALTRE